MMEATATEALTTVWYCDSICQTTHALTANAAPNWIISFGLLHQTCNDCSSVSTFVKHSHAVIIKLCEYKSVTAAHCGFIYSKHGYQVDVLNTSAFWLSLLSIDNFDLGSHTTIFRNAQCTLTSPYFRTFTGNLINFMHIIDSTIPQILTTTVRNH